MINRKELKTCAQVFAVTALLAPVHQQLHEVGHWLPAKIMGAKDLQMNYKEVSSDEADAWPDFKLGIFSIGGPVVTNALVWTGATLLAKESKSAKLVGWALAAYTLKGLLLLPAYLNRVLRSVPRNEHSDEAHIALYFHVPGQLVRSGEFFLNLYLLLRSYQKLPGNKLINLLSGYCGVIAGVALHYFIIGPKLFPKKEQTHDRNNASKHPDRPGIDRTDG